MRWLVMDIGCLECHATSDVVGIYATEKQANDVANILKKNREAYYRDEGGHQFKVFDLLAKRDPFYASILEQAKEVTE